MTVDLEDWFCVQNLSLAIKKEDWGRCELRLEDNTGRILDLFGRHKVKATFFVLGWIVERLPELVREIERHGHEIATHGYSHTMLTEIKPEEFEADLERAIAVTEPLIRQKITGFRAPTFSLTQRTLWAADILVRHGILYDSSVFPAHFHPDYGMPDAPFSIYQLTPSLIEVPLSCVKILGMTVPCGGGGYFRLYPYRLTRMFLRRLNRQGRPAVFYFHPWELDPEQPRVKLPRTKKLRHYLNLNKTAARLERLLDDFRFTTLRNLLGLEEASAGR